MSYKQAHGALEHLDWGDEPAEVSIRKARGHANPTTLQDILTELEALENTLADDVPLTRFAIQDKLESIKLAVLDAIHEAGE